MVTVLIRLRCMVVSVHPAFNQHGEEFVVVEFGVRSEPPPKVVTVPQGMHEEAKAMMSLLSQIPRVMGVPQPKGYDNRLTVFFRVDEWRRLEHKYVQGEEVEVEVDLQSGELRLKPVG